MKTLIKTLSTAMMSLTLVSLSLGAADEMTKDHLMMKGGEIMMMKADGKSMAIDKEMTLKDGTKVMVDGTVVPKDGEKMMMKEGEAISMEGKRIKTDLKGN